MIKRCVDGTWEARFEQDGSTATFKTEKEAKAWHVGKFQESVKRTHSTSPIVAPVSTVQKPPARAEVDSGTSTRQTGQAVSPVVTPPPLPWSLLSDTQQEGSESSLFTASTVTENARVAIRHVSARGNTRAHGTA